MVTIKKLGSWLKANWQFLALIFILVPICGIAADVVPVPQPVEGSFTDWLQHAITLFKDWKTLGIWAGIAAVVKLVVDATNTQFLGGLFDKLGPAGKALLIAVAGCLVAGTTVLASGGSVVEAVGAALASSGGAVALNELIKLIKEAIGLKEA